jgi:hypothetical protein
MKTKILASRVFLIALFLLLAAAPSFAYVLGDTHYYRFDDISGSSGQGAQWVVVTDRMNSVGAPVGGQFREEIKTSGNIVTSRDYVYIKNAALRGIVSDDEPIRFIFAALPGTSVSPAVEFEWRGSELPEAGSYAQDITIGQDAYSAVKTQLSEKTDPIKRILFELTKTRDTFAFGTEYTYMRFHQNPEAEPSQTLQIPFVLANVADGSAKQAPLLFRTAVRDLNDDIAAYDQFEWAVDENKEVGGGNDWIFVPVQNEDINSVSARYRLVTNVRNFCGIRYGLDRYDLLGIRETLRPARWTMDLPSSVKNISPDIVLDELSHISPGLITTYNQPFEVAGGRQSVFSVYAVDPVGGAPLNPFSLTLAHPLIFGVRRGVSTGDVYSVTGFELLPADVDFFRKAASNLGARRIAMPSADIVSGTNVTGGFITTDAVSTIKINAAMPDNLLKSNDVTGILPLHVTINLPAGNRFIGPLWDNLAEEFKKNGSARDLFAENFSLYSYSAAGRRTDLFEWLMNNSALEKIVKVFVDEEKGCLTLSFIVMLTDGGANIRTLHDASAVSNYSCDYLAMGDGNEDNVWDIAFYVAPLTGSPGGEGAPGDGESSGSSGGGGCGAEGVSAGFLLPAFLALALRKARKTRQNSSSRSEL